MTPWMTVFLFDTNWFTLNNGTDTVSGSGYRICSCLSPLVLLGFVGDGNEKRT